MKVRWAARKRMKNKIIYGMTAFLFLVGILIFNYPVISTLYNQLHQGTVMSNYDETLSQMKQAQLDALREEAEQYNRNLAGGGQEMQDAFSGETEEEDLEYDGVLDMEESGVMGAVEIPKINVYLPIYHGTSQDVLNVGVGHLKGSSLPVGGESTHSVLTGHRGLPTAELFTNLDQIEKGDVFYVHILKETLAYRVYDIETVLPEEVGSIRIEEGRDMITLVTCTPYGINSHRLLIHALRTEYRQAEANQEKVRKETLWHWLWQQKTFLASFLAVVLALLYGVFRLIKKRLCRKRKGERVRKQQRRRKE